MLAIVSQEKNRKYCQGNLIFVKMLALCLRKNSNVSGCPGVLLVKICPVTKELDCIAVITDKKSCKSMFSSKNIARCFTFN